MSPYFNYLIIGLFIWLLILTLMLYKTVGHYRRLTRGQNKPGLDQILDHLIGQADLNKKQLEKIANVASQIQQTQKVHFQKFAITRFNPFEDTGGDQSFTIALLDGENNGIVVTSLHSRSGTRVYAKEVSAAQAKNYQFSKEEKEVVEKAATTVANKTARHVQRGFN